MRKIPLLIALLSVPTSHAAVLHVTGESLSPVDQDDWSIPLRRCFLSSETGAGVYDGAERCALEFAVPLGAGRKIRRVGALYEDGGFDPEIEMSLRVRDIGSGENLTVIADKDFSAATLTVLNTLWLEPNYLIGTHDAAFLRVEVRGDTQLLTLTYEYE
jgi:hypothetical protein